MILNKHQVKTNDKLLRSAYASKIAYMKDYHSSKLQKYSQQLQTTDAEARQFIHDRKTGLNAFSLNTGENSHLIAFKGSSTWQDIITFADARMVEFSYRDAHVKVHSGVFRMFESIEPILTKLIYPNNPELTTPQYITFTGHSLGGALAIMAAAYYGNMSNKNSIITCHTFGTPKVGDVEFCNWYQQGVYESANIINYTDVVPCLPSLNTYATVDVMNIVNDSPIFWNKIDPFTNHDLDTYIDLLRKINESQKVPP